MQVRLLDYADDLIYRSGKTRSEKADLLTSMVNLASADGIVIVHPNVVGPASPTS